MTELEWGGKWSRTFFQDVHIFMDVSVFCVSVTNVLNFKWLWSIYCSISWYVRLYLVGAILRVRHYDDIDSTRLGRNNSNAIVEKCTSTMWVASTTEPGSPYLKPITVYTELKGKPHCQVSHIHTEKLHLLHVSFILIWKWWFIETCHSV